VKTHLLPKHSSIDLMDNENLLESRSHQYCPNLWKVGGIREKPMKIVLYIDGSDAINGLETKKKTKMPARYYLNPIVKEIVNNLEQFKNTKVLHLGSTFVSIASKPFF